MSEAWVCVVCGEPAKDIKISEYVRSGFCDKHVPPKPDEVFSLRARVAVLEETLVDRRSGRSQCRGCSAFLDDPKDAHTTVCWAAPALISSPTPGEAWRAMVEALEFYGLPSNSLLRSGLVSAVRVDAGEKARAALAAAKRVMGK